MDMDRRQFVVFMLAVLYGPLLADRVQESYRPERPDKPRPVRSLAFFASAGPALVEANLSPSPLRHENRAL